jgi:hypothetical protein
MIDVAGVAKPNARTELPMNSEQASLTPVAAPVGVRWREFRIQILPVLAFGGALLLAGLLWVKAVLPVPVEPLPDPPSISEQPVAPVQSFASPPIIHQASHGATNGIGRSTAGRE